MYALKYMQPLADLHICVWQKHIGWKICKYTSTNMYCAGDHHAVDGHRGDTISSLLWLLPLPQQVWLPGSALNVLSTASNLVQQLQNTLLLLQYASEWRDHSELEKGKRHDWDEQRMQWRWLHVQKMYTPLLLIHPYNLNSITSASILNYCVTKTE